MISISDSLLLLIFCLFVFHSSRVRVAMRPRRSAHQPMHQEVVQSPAAIPRQGSARAQRTADGAAVRRPAEHGQRRRRRAYQSLVLRHSGQGRQQLHHQRSAQRCPSKWSPFSGLRKCASSPINKRIEIGIKIGIKIGICALTRQFIHFCRRSLDILINHIFLPRFRVFL